MSVMRISTTNMFSNSTARISEAQSGLLKTQQQISTNRRLLSPADDPVAAARALDISQSQSINATYASNRVIVKNALEQEEGALQGVTTLLQNIKTQLVQAGNPTLDWEQKKYIATDLRGQLDQLMGLVNARDGTGNFIFGGFQNQSQPFARSSNGSVQYRNDQGQTALQVGPARQLATGDTGDAVFMRIANDNVGTAAATTNTGDLAISPLTVTNSAALTGHRYEVMISGVGTPGGAVYSVYDMDLDPGQSGTPAATGAWVSGATVAVDGMSFNLSGTTPANGDAFSVDANAQQDIFHTLDGLIRALETPGAAQGSGLRLGRSLAMSNQNFENALDNVLSVRASVGARLREIDSLDGAGEDRNIQYQQQLAELQDLDLVKALSDFTMQKQTLEAAYKAYSEVSRLSLFAML